MSLFWIALLAVVVWAVARIVPSRGGAVHSGSLPSKPEEPLEILNRRLASGEIDVKTYHQLRSELSSKRAGGMG